MTSITFAAISGLLQDFVIPIPAPPKIPPIEPKPELGIDPNSIKFFLKTLLFAKKRDTIMESWRGERVWRRHHCH